MCLFSPPFILMKLNIYYVRSNRGEGARTGSLRNNWFFCSDSVELQKLTLQQVTLIDRYEKDAEQAINWLEDILRVMLRDHGHVGCTVYEIQSQKEEHQVFQETAKVCLFIDSQSNFI